MVFTTVLSMPQPQTNKHTNSEKTNKQTKNKQTSKRRNKQRKCEQINEQTNKQKKTKHTSKKLESDNELRKFVMVDVFSDDCRIQKFCNILRKACMCGQHYYVGACFMVRQIES